MKITVSINDVKTLHEIPGYWSNEDYLNLLEEFNYPDAASADPSELRELLEMAISDFESDESAEILLNYVLGEELNTGQIKNLSHEMADDNQSEEYPDPALHYPLFCINQMLHKAYNGIFPNAKATKIELELIFKEGVKVEAGKELLLKAISGGLNSNCLIRRLYEDQLEGKEPFDDAEDIIWEIHNHGQNKYTIITSDYWMNDDDILEYVFTNVIKFYEEDED